MDIDRRLEAIAGTPAAILPPEEVDGEDFIVEKIIKKQFNARSGQFEFLVKWQGYSAKHNTWELITNVPDAVLHKFEQDKLTSATTHAPTRAGLRDRQTIKPNYKPDYNYI